MGMLKESRVQWRRRGAIGIYTQPEFPIVSINVFLPYIFLWTSDDHPRKKQHSDPIIMINYQTGQTSLLPFQTWFVFCILFGEREETRGDPIDIFWLEIPKEIKAIHPGRLTWNLRIQPWKRNIFQFTSFGFYVTLRGCTISISTCRALLPTLRNSLQEARWRWCEREWTVNPTILQRHLSWFQYSNWKVHGF